MALIEDIHLIGTISRNSLGIRTTKENATVGVFIDPELRPQLKITVGRLRRQKPRAPVSLHGAIYQLPTGVADGVPAIQARANPMATADQRLIATS